MRLCICDLCLYIYSLYVYSMYAYMCVYHPSAVHVRVCPWTGTRRACVGSAALADGVAAALLMPTCPALHFFFCSLHRPDRGLMIATTKAVSVAVSASIGPLGHKRPSPLDGQAPIQMPILGTLLLHTALRRFIRPGPITAAAAPSTTRLAREMPAMLPCPRRDAPCMAMAALARRVTILSTATVVHPNPGPR